MKSRIAFAATVFAIAAGLAYGQSTVTVVGPITPGDCAKFNSTTIIADAGVNCASGGGGSGTVTSVSLSLPNLVFSVSGSPVTNNGTLTGTFLNQGPNTFLGSPVGGLVGQPLFRNISGTDLPLPSPTTRGGVQAAGPTTSQYVNAILTSGLVTLKQPDFAELTGMAAPAQLPIATPSTFGVIEANAPLASNWVTGWTAGVPQVAQPSFSDIAGNIAPSQLPPSGNNTVISNISGSTQTPVPNSQSAVFDASFGSAQGDILFRTTSAWTVLPPGVQGQVLATSGVNLDPVWINAAGGGTLQTISPNTTLFFSSSPCTVSCVMSVASSANNTLLANTSGGSAPPVATSPSTLLNIFSSTQGSILYRGASIWQALIPGTAGQFLQTNGAGATPSWAGVNLSRFTNSLAGNVNITATSTFFDGPSVSQGTSGTWFASGTVAVQDPSTATSNFVCKLWDGTTVIASASLQTNTTGHSYSLAMSGVITSPSGNIRISCANVGTTTSRMNASTALLATTNASTVTAVRLQ